MSDIRFVSAFTLIGVGLLSNSSAYALGVGTIDRSPWDKNYLHTSTPSTEPAPLFAQLDKAYKTAGICFLGVGDCAPSAGFDSAPSSGGGDDEDFDINTGNQCLNEGFSKQNCNAVQVIDGVCPYSSAYGRGCKCSSNLIECPAGQVGVGDSCDGKYASCKCDPNLKSCSSKEVGQGASCGGKYESCVCKSEYQYTSSNCTYPRSTSGDNCQGKYTNCVCPSGVSSTPYGCEEYYPSPCNSVCKIAYPDNCRNRDNASTPYSCAKYWDDCKSKCETAYNDNCRNRTAVTCSWGCKSSFADCQSKCEICNPDNCHNRTAVISSCPANATCQYFSDCSSKISSWSCNSGYKKSGNSCIKNDPCDTVTAVVSSCPANATCSYYSVCPSKVSSWSCNYRYVKSGNSCVLDPACSVTPVNCLYCVAWNSCGICTQCEASCCAACRSFAQHCDNGETSACSQVTPCVNSCGGPCGNI